MNSIAESLRRGAEKRIQSHSTYDYFNYSPKFHCITSTALGAICEGIPDFQIWQIIRMIGIKKSYLLGNYCYNLLKANFPHIYKELKQKSGDILRCTIVDERDKPCYNDCYSIAGFINHLSSYHHCGRLVIADEVQKIESSLLSGNLTFREYNK